MTVTIIDLTPDPPVRIVFPCRWGSCTYQVSATGFNAETDAQRFRATARHLRDDHEQIEHGGITHPLWHGGSANQLTSGPA